MNSVAALLAGERVTAESAQGGGATMVTSVNVADRSGAMPLMPIGTTQVANQLPTQLPSIVQDRTM